MNGFGAYANPLTDEWGDYINITEYFVNDYDKNNLIPLRFKIKNNWEKFDEQNIDIGKVRRDVLTKVEYPISSLPPLKGGKDTEFWSLENVYDENGTRAGIKMMYGDILDTKNPPRTVMGFDIEYDYSDYGTFVAKKDNIPDSFTKAFEEIEPYFYKEYDPLGRYAIGWEERKDEAPTFTTDSSEINAKAFMRWCVMTEIQPELLEYFKCKKVASYKDEKLVIVPKNFEFDDEKLDAILEARSIEDKNVFYADELCIELGEDGSINFGFDDIIAEMKKQEEQISMQESLTQALKSGATTENVARAKEVESKQENKEAEIRTE